MPRWVLLLHVCVKLAQPAAIFNTRMHGTCCRHGLQRSALFMLSCILEWCKHEGATSRSATLVLIRALFVTRTRWRLQSLLTTWGDRPVEGAKRSLLCVLPAAKAAVALEVIQTVQQKVRHNDPVIQSSNHPIIQSSNHPIIQSSNHPIIQSSNHPTIQPSNHPTIQASKHPIILSSNHPAQGVRLVEWHSGSIAASGWQHTVVEKASQTTMAMQCVQSASVAQVQLPRALHRTRQPCGVAVQHGSLVYANNESGRNGRRVESVHVLAGRRAAGEQPDKAEQGLRAAVGRQGQVAQDARQGLDSRSVIGILCLLCHATLDSANETQDMQCNGRVCSCQLPMFEACARSGLRQCAAVV
jgi:hypothetical protein